MILETRLWLVAALALSAFVALGFYVSTHGLSRFDVESASWRGTSTGLAGIFTLSGRSLPLLALGSLSLVLCFVFHRNIYTPMAIFASQLVSQGVVELFKHLFKRSRPDDWLIHHELGYSYPSGHATTAIVFFVAWAILVNFMPVARPLKVLLVVLLLFWAVGIDWSRMALSAHYFTDVLGGTLFGIAWLCLMGALVFRFFPFVMRV